MVLNVRLLTRADVDVVVVVVGVVVDVAVVIANGRSVDASGSFAVVAALLTHAETR